MRKAMAKNEAVRTVDEIEQDKRQRERMLVIREFVESKTNKPGKVGRN
jgi:RNA polymerase primary sigma factor